MDEAKLFKIKNDLTTLLSELNGIFVCYKIMFYEKNIEIARQKTQTIPVHTYSSVYVELVDALWGTRSCEQFVRHEF